MKTLAEEYIGFWAPAHLAKPLKALAHQQSVPKSYLLRRAVQLLLTEAETTNRLAPPPGYRWARDDDPAS